jgi:group I intron endonuclease
MIGIYKITNPNNKIYIGQSIDIEKRFKQYKSLDCKRQPKIYNSFLKYDIEQHIFEIIEECLVEQLNEREIYWKQYYNTISEGLNCELYDNSIGPKSENTKQKLRKPKPEGFGAKISLSKKDHICYSDPKRGNNISKTSKGKSKPEGFGTQQSIRLSGKKRSEGTKAKMKKPHATYKNRIGKPRGKYKKTQLWETSQNL